MIKESIPVVQHEIIIKDDIVEIVILPDIKDSVSENTETGATIELKEDNMLNTVEENNSIELKELEDGVSDERNEAQQTDTETLQCPNIEVEASNESTNMTTNTTEHQTLCVSGSITDNNQQSSVTFIMDGNNLQGKMHGKNNRIIVKNSIII